jgi:hypothetical protein
MNTTIYEKHGLTGQLIFENAVSKLMNGLASLDEAMDYIMEFARGHWSLVIDENLEDLVRELERLNYDVVAVPKGISDDDIRRNWCDDVFITSNDRDFSLLEVPSPFRRGMIIVPNGVDARRLAQVIERRLMTWRKDHGGPVKVQVLRGDLR